MGNSSQVLEETRCTLDRQTDEIRDQRSQALKILRVYFAVAAILIAVFSTLLTTSSILPFDLNLANGSIVAPIIVIIGIILTSRGVITFFRGIYSALEVLSVESVEAHQWIRLFQIFIAFLRGTNLPGRDTYHLALGPDFNKVRNADDMTAKLIDEHVENIQINSQTIESNNSHLRDVYEKMSAGITGFGIGLAILFLSI